MIDKPFDLSLLLYAELADSGDISALRVLEARVQKDPVLQERYIEYLLGAVFPTREFEITTAPVLLHGNEVRARWYTTDLFALVNASHDRRVGAALHALHLKRK